MNVAHQIGGAGGIFHLCFISGRPMTCLQTDLPFREGSTQLLHFNASVGLTSPSQRVGMLPRRGSPAFVAVRIIIFLVALTSHGCSRFLTKRTVVRTAMKQVHSEQTMK